MLFRFWVDQIKLGTIGKLMRCCKQPLECVLASFPGRKPVNEARMFVGVVSYAMLQWHCHHHHLPSHCHHLLLHCLYLLLHHRCLYCYIAIIT